MPPVIEDWLELESDPGLFTMLLENIGVKGVQVEDIYDLNEEIKEEVFGFVFLFKWTDESRKNKRSENVAHNSNNECNKIAGIYNFNSPKNIVYETDIDKLNKIYFAHQVIPNSCATNALLSVLMNCNDRINLGSVLNNFREMTLNMTPEKRGLALGTMPELANAHNKRGKYSCLNIQNNSLSYNMGTLLSTSKSSFNENNPETDEMYHFVSYLPIGDGLYELDGLQQYPIKHGVTKDSENWTKLCLDMIRNRMLQKSDHYSLMAVVKDRRKVLADQLIILNKNKSVLKHALLQMEQLTSLKLNVKGDFTNRNQIKDSDDKKKTTLENSSAVEVIENDSEDLGRIKVEKVRRMSNRVLLKNQRKAEELKVNKTVPTLKEISPSKKAKLNLRSIKSTSKNNDHFSNQSLPIEPRSTRRKRNLSKYPTRSSTEHDTLVSNSIAHSRSSCNTLDKIELNFAFNKFPTFCPEKIKQLINVVDDSITNCKTKMIDEIEKRKKYVMDDMRRNFNYDDFIHAFLFALKKQGILEELLKKQTQKLLIKKPTKRSYRSRISSKRLKLITVQETTILRKFSKKSSLSNRKCAKN